MPESVWMIHKSSEMSHKSLPVFPQVHGGGGYDSDFSDEDGQGESSQRGLKRSNEGYRII